MTTKTQCEAIQSHLQSGGTLTPLDALNLFDCFRLGARIFDLKKKGLDIKTRIIEVGDKKHVAEYYL
jgi:hypothetical protein